MELTWGIAAIWLGLALVASLLSIRFKMSVALVEILVGVVAGNLALLLEHYHLFGLHWELKPNEWIAFLAGFGSILLTFMAGAEIEPSLLRKSLKETLCIGFASFLAPFLGAMLYARFVSGWDWNASLICGIALSTTSVAVVYAVMIETGLNETELGKLILAACFVTDLGTVVALGICFANYNWTLGAVCRGGRHRALAGPWIRQLVFQPLFNPHERAGSEVRLLRALRSRLFGGLRQ